jgi:hypothetical protein
MTPAIQTLIQFRMIDQEEHLDMVEPWRLDTEVVRDMASSLLPP